MFEPLDREKFCSCLIMGYDIHEGFQSDCRGTTEVFGKSQITVAKVNASPSPPLFHGFILSYLWGLCLFEMQTGVIVCRSLFI